jgi:hypothetical protein
MGRPSDKPQEISHTKAIVMAGWDDAAHLGDEEKRELLSSCEPHLRESRSLGIPNLGSGAVYDVPTSEFVIDPIKIKPWFKRCYGMDVGWNWTAVVWGALDPDTDVLYLYDCYKREKEKPEVHASAIQRRGKMVGAIDPAARTRSQVDGNQLLKLYRSEGLKLVPAENAVEATIYEVWSRLSTGRLKVVEGAMSHWLNEYRMYRRDIHGKIVKVNDHLMDATRYLAITGLKHAKPLQASRPVNVQSRDYGF